MKIRNIYSRFGLLLVIGLIMGAMALQGMPASKAKTKLNLNTATEKELTALPGIGEATAQKIIAARPFKSVEDLKNVSGIGQSKFDELKDLVTVEKAASVKTTKSETAKETKVQGLVDINTADQKALESLPGVGEATAKKIIAARPFKSVDDLKNVGGIGEAKFNSLKDLVTIEDEDSAVTPKLKPGETININKASRDDLEKLLGIGPVKAQAIIEGRPYSKKEDIMKVKGIKEKTFAKLKDWITVR